MDRLVLLCFLAIPALGREVAHFVTKRGQPIGRRVGGTVSVLIWIPCHLTMLGCAAYAILMAPMGVLSWVGYAVYCLAILLRVAALCDLRKFYSPDVVIREGHRVISSGTYRFLRHPLHTATIIEMAGLLLVCRVWVTSVLVLACLVTHVVRSRKEGSASRALPRRAVSRIQSSYLGSSRLDSGRGSLHAFLILSAGIIA